MPTLGTLISNLFPDVSYHRLSVLSNVLLPKFWIRAWHSFVPICRPKRNPFLPPQNQWFFHSFAAFESTCLQGGIFLLKRFPSCFPRNLRIQGEVFRLPLQNQRPDGHTSAVAHTTLNNVCCRKNFRDSKGIAQKSMTTTIYHYILWLSRSLYILHALVLHYYV